MEPADEGSFENAAFESASLQKLGNPLHDSDGRLPIEIVQQQSVAPESLATNDWLTLKAELTKTSQTQSGQNGKAKLELKENERDRRRRIALEYLEESSIMSPDSGFRKKWDITQLVFVIYVALGVPYRIGFSSDVELWVSDFLSPHLSVAAHGCLIIMMALTSRVNCCRAFRGSGSTWSWTFTSWWT